jgi:predicted negative regulator of RcsB-dependent stress response
MASPSVARRTSRTPVESDDVVMLRAAELAAWAQKNTQAVIIGAVVLVLTLGGIVYYRMYSAQREERASMAFLNLQASLSTDTAAVTRQLETFASNYSGTSEAAEARILAAQLWLAKGDANKAIAAVRPAAGGGTLKEQAQMVLASALAAGNQRGEAIDTYLDVAKGTKLNYLKQDALAQAAALREQANDWKGAADLYAQAVETTEKGTSVRTVFLLHLAEAQAHAGLPVSAPQ